MTSIEAGHFYLYEDEKGEPPGFLEEQNLGVQLAVQFALQSETAVQFLLFIDDYHGNPELEKDWDDEAIYQNLLSHPDALPAYEAFAEHDVQPMVISELAFTSTAAHLYNLLLNKGVMAKGNKQLLPDFGSISLLTKNGDPTCSLIDSALYLKKIGIHKDEPTMTVLPERYKSQQEQVKAILAAYGLAHPPITIIYHNEAGEVVEVDDWSKGGK